MSWRSFPEQSQTQLAMHLSSQLFLGRIKTALGRNRNYRPNSGHRREMAVVFRNTCVICRERNIYRLVLSGQKVSLFILKILLKNKWSWLTCNRIKIDEWNRNQNVENKKFSQRKVSNVKWVHRNVYSLLLKQMAIGEVILASTCRMQFCGHCICEKVTIIIL